MGWVGVKCAMDLKSVGVFTENGWMIKFGSETLEK